MDRLASIQGKIRRNKKNIESFKELLSDLKETNPLDRRVSLYQRDIWDLENEIVVLMNEFRGKGSPDEIPRGIGGIWLHISDVLEYVGLLDLNFKSNYQKIKRIINLIPKEEYENNLRAKENIEYIMKKLRGEIRVEKIIGQ